MMESGIDWPKKTIPKKGYNIPTSGGYGRDKHIYIAEFPPHLFCNIIS